MIKSIFTLLCLFLLSISAINAQIWKAQNPAFPKPTQGWRITMVDEKVAWTFGYTLDSMIPAGEFDWTENDYSFSRTIDGGNLWTTGKFPDGVSGFLSNLAAVSANEAWLSYNDYDDGSKIFHTTDGGVTWNEPSLIVDSWVNAIHFFDSKNGVILADPIGATYTIFTTQDGGTNWRQVDSAKIPVILDTDEAGMTASFAEIGNKIWFSTTNNRIYYSKDKGLTWAVWESPKNARGDGHQLEVDDNDNVYFSYTISGDSTTNFTDSFMLYRRGGIEPAWTNITPVDHENYIIGLSRIPGTPSIIMNISVINETRLSTDKGVSWKTIDTSFNKGYIEFFNPKAGYSCEMPKDYDHPSKNVFRYIGSPLTGILNPGIVDFSLTMSPNPFADRLEIKLKSPNAEDYWILINDIQGKLIQKIEVNRTKEHIEIIDTKNLNSGTYIITVSNSSGMLAEKLIKL